MTVYNASNIGVFISYGATGWSANSDKRLKHTINDLPDSLDTVNKLRPVSFYFNKGSDKKHIGFIAQEVEEVIPEIISNGGFDKGLNDYIKGIDMISIIPYLVKSIQEQQKQIDGLISLLKSKSII